MSENVGVFTGVHLKKIRTGAQVFLSHVCACIKGAKYIDNILLCISKI